MSWLLSQVANHCEDVKCARNLPKSGAVFSITVITGMNGEKGYENAKEQDTNFYMEMMGCMHGGKTYN